MSILFLFSYTTLAQCQSNKLDSLRKLIATSENLDSTRQHKLDLLSYLVNEGRTNRSYQDSIYHYYKEGVQSSVSKKNLVDEVCYIYWYAYNLTINENNVAQSNEIIDKAKQIIVSNPDVNFGKIEGKVYLLLGYNNRISGLYKEAFDHYNLCLEVSYNLKDSMTISKALLNIGIIHNNIGNNDLARDYYEKSITIDKALGNKGLMVYGYNNVAYIDQQNKNYKKAEENYQKGYDLAEELNMSDLKTTILINLGTLHREMDEPEKARVYFDQGYKSAVANSHDLDMALAFVNIESIDKNSRKNANTIKKIEEALSLAQEKGDATLERESLSLLTSVHYNNQNHKKAYDYLTRLNTLNESLSQNELKKEIEMAQYRADLEIVEKEKEMKKEQNEVILKESLLHSQNIRKLLLISIIALSLLLALLFFNFSKVIKAMKDIELKNRQLLETEKSLAKNNKDLKKYIDLNIQLEQFAHIASHDIKSPLRTIGSFVGLLKKSSKDKLDTKETEYLDLIETGAVRLNVLIDDLLDYTKANSKKLKLTDVNLKLLIEAVRSDLEYNINKNNAKIDVDLHTKWVIADKTMIKQVVQNLIDNALKFRRQNTPCVITIKSWEDEEYSYVAVKDNGIGISDKYKEQIFEKFAKLNSNDKYEGSGLGLSICNQIINRHEGTLEVSSNPDYGSTFTLSISKSLSAQPKLQTT